MTCQTWKSGKAIRPFFFFADLVTNINHNTRGGGWALRTRRQIVLRGQVWILHGFVSSCLLIGNYYCGVRNFWKLFLADLNLFLERLNDAARETNQTTNAFWWCVHLQRKIEVQSCDKVSSFPGVTARNLIYCRNRFPPQGSSRINHHCSCILMRTCKQQFSRMSVFFIHW